MFSARTLSALPLGLGVLTMCPDLSAQGWTRTPADVSGFGSSVTIIPDLHGDGIDDVLVGSRGNEGRLLLGHNGAGTFVPNALLGGLSGQYLAYIQGASDTPYLLSGDPTYGTGGNSGRAILRGENLTLIYYGDDHSGLGTSVDSLGQIDTDPGEEWIIGAPGNFGSHGGYAQVISWVSSLRHEGEQRNEGFGFAVAGLDDLDGDGYPDYAVGSPYYNRGTFITVIDSGKVTIYSGRTHGVLDTLNDGGYLDHLGWDVDDAGDVDGDGVRDIIVGLPGPSGEKGKARVYSGATRDVLFTVTGEHTAERLGFAVAGLGDVNGDGLSDVAIGAPFNSQSAIQAGRVLVYSGTGELLREIHGPVIGAQLGHSVGGGGDLNGDGIPDLVAGAPGIDAHGTDSGGVLAYYSCPGEELHYGNGWAGTQGVPVLDLLGEPRTDVSSATLRLGNSSGTPSTALLFVGLAPTHIPTNRGGALLVAPTQIFPLSLPAGGLDLPVSVPASLAPAGQCLPTAYLQTLQPDAGASHGFAFSGGLRLRFGNLIEP